jgi:hypothetical protein
MDRSAVEVMERTARLALALSADPAVINTTRATYTVRRLRHCCKLCRSRRHRCRTNG